MKKRIMPGVTFVMALFAAGQAFAHSPLCSCFDNGDGSITCEGGFSDGSAAAGVEARVEDGAGKAILKGKMDSLGEYTFRKPKVPFTFVFDAGPGHVVKIKGKDIRK